MDIQSKIRWGGAAGMSILLHAVILSLLAATAGGKPAVTADTPAAASADGAPDLGARVGETTDAPPVPAATATSPDGKETAGSAKESEPAAEKPRKPAARSKPAPKTAPEEIRAKGGTPPKAEAQAVSDRPAVYVVKAGDTLTHIARDNGLTIAELAHINKTTPKKLANIKVGQKLKLR